MKGDKVRLKYVLACLVKNTIERNHKFGDQGIIQVKATVTNNEEIVDLFGDNEDMT